MPMYCGARWLDAVAGMRETGADVAPLTAAKPKKRRTRAIRRRERHCRWPIAGFDHLGGRRGKSERARRVAVGSLVASISGARRAGDGRVTG